MSALTARQVQLLRLVQQGLSTREIAERLDITTSAVGWHIHRIFTRLGVRNRAAAVMKAANLGLIESMCLQCAVKDARIEQLEDALALVEAREAVKHEGALR